jgi:hypothetical protein
MILGTAKAATVKMMATVTINSRSENPRWLLRMGLRDVVFMNFPCIGALPSSRTSNGLRRSILLVLSMFSAVRRGDKITEDSERLGMGGY